MGAPHLQRVTAPSPSPPPLLIPGRARCSGGLAICTRSGLVLGSSALAPDGGRDSAFARGVAPRGPRSQRPTSSSPPSAPTLPVRAAGGCGQTAPPPALAQSQLAAPPRRPRGPLHPSPRGSGRRAVGCGAGPPPAPSGRVATGAALAAIFCSCRAGVVLKEAAAGCWGGSGDTGLCGLGRGVAQRGEQAGAPPGSPGPLGARPGPTLSPPSCTWAGAFPKRGCGRQSPPWAPGGSPHPAPHPRPDCQHPRFPSPRGLRARQQLLQPRGAGSPAFPTPPPLPDCLRGWTLPHGGRQKCFQQDGWKGAHFLLATVFFFGGGGVTTWSSHYPPQSVNGFSTEGASKKTAV